VREGFARSISLADRFKAIVEAEAARAAEDCFLIFVS
jgi:hypothetical protein